MPPKLPSRTSKHKYRITRLPIGSYFVHQHLIGESYEYEFEGKTSKGNQAIYVYGGVPVQLEAGRKSDRGDFIDLPGGTLDVQLRDSLGRPSSAHA